MHDFIWASYMYLRLRVFRHLHRVQGLGCRVCRFRFKGLSLSQVSVHVYCDVAALIRPYIHMYNTNVPCVRGHLWFPIPVNTTKYPWLLFYLGLTSRSMNSTVIKKDTYGSYSALHIHKTTFPIPLGL